LEDKLKDLKNEISNTIENFPNEVDKNFATGIKWVHTKEIDEKEQDYTLKDKLKNETSDTLQGITQLILGMIGTIFIKYGIDEGNNSYWKREYSSSILFKYGMDFYHQQEKTDFQIHREKYSLLINKYID